MQEAGLKGKKHSALRKMLPLLIGLSLGLAVVLASRSQVNYRYFLYYGNYVEVGGQQIPTGVEYGYGYPVPYIVHRYYWNLSTQPWSSTESVEFNLGNLIVGWLELSVIITLGIVAYKGTDEWILEHSRDG